MTYCVGLQLERGLVFLSDTRTNAGVDNISTYPKMHTWEVPGERSLVLMTAGNLATTQAVVSLLDERNLAPDDRDPSLLTVPSMFQAARLIGNTLASVIKERTNAKGGTFSASMILGGQVAGSPPRLYLIYPEGNFIEAGDDTPFLQVGETKYGRPILVRAYQRDMTFEAAVKLLTVSFDSTMKANLSVGMPLDLSIYELDSLDHRPQIRIESDNEYYQSISSGWSSAIQSAFQSLPDYDLD